MSNQPDFNNIIGDLINSAENIAIIPSEIAGADSFCAAAGMYLTLLHQNKSVSFVYIADIPEEAKGLLTEEQIISDIYSRKLEISIDYSGTPASKLAYSNENNILKLVLSPVADDFDRSKVKTQIKGADFDLIIVVGAQRIEDLGGIGKGLRDEFMKAKILNIDNTRMNTHFGDFDLVDTSASSLSEAIFKLSSKLELVPSGVAARALLTGMTYREPQS